MAEFYAAVTEGQPITSGSSAQALAVMELVEEIYAADPTWPLAMAGTADAN